MAYLYQLIKEKSMRNKNCEDLPLLGINKNKEFMPSVANTIGTDLSSYKIINKGQFAVNLMHVDRDEIVPVSLLTDYEKAIVSPAYNVFEIIDESTLNSEYLMLCFKGNLFDKNAWFLSGSSVRGNLEWRKFLEIDIPLPNIEEQLRIVSEYKSIEERISIKEEINNNLLEQAILLFKNYYKNLDAFDDNLICLKDFCIKISSGGTPSREISCYWDSNDYNWLKNGEIKNNIILDTDEYISKKGLDNSSAQIITKNSVSMAMYCVSNIQVSFNCIDLTTNQAVLNFQTEDFMKSCIIYYLLAAFGNEITTKANGSAQQNLSKDIIQSYKFKCPKLKHNFFNYLVSNMKERIVITKEIFELHKLRSSLIERINKQ